MYIVKPAILYSNGEVLIAPIGSSVLSLYGYRNLQWGDYIPGFVDEKGEFHDRYEAKKIALEAGQIKETESDALYAEDLWPEPITAGR